LLIDIPKIKLLRSQFTTVRQVTDILDYDVDRIGMTILLLG
jgi:hypothetical protein